jgi:transcriptional antiterminator Rof (Rho-off)
MNEGIIREEAAAYFMAIASESQHLDRLGDHERRLLEQIQNDQLSRLLPISMERATAGGTSDDFDWLEVAGRHPQQCTVALSDGYGLGATIRDVVNRVASDLPIVALPVATSFPWLEDPERVDVLVRQLLGQ